MTPEINWPTMPPSKGQSTVLFEDGYAEGWAKCLEACHAAVEATLSAPQQAEGWVMVPVEPTQQMCQEGQWKAQEWPKFPLRIVPIWKAMLAATPSAPTAVEPICDGCGKTIPEHDRLLRCNPPTTTEQAT